jgi:maltooligosyltrehalose trehalohydrolase
MPQAAPSRRYPIGAEPTPGSSEATHFRVWAPRRRRVDVVIGGDAFALQPEEAAAPGAGGYFSGAVAGVGDGARYQLRLDGEGMLYPDPASRFQPEGPHGPSQIVDPSRFPWTDGGWRGVAGAAGQVVYELHIGTFTPEGTYEAARAQLPALADLGVTIVEVMPVAEFPGRFGWGYDGVDLWAPCHLYGTPDDLRRLVDAAHGLGLGVILDVVYNHFGPDGNYLHAFSGDYVHETRATEWGSSINFDGAGSGPVREFFVENAGYWIDELHFDGLRLDATQTIVDESPDHVLAAVGRRARAAGQAHGRGVFVVAENDEQDARLARPAAAGGRGLDAAWNDDFHHATTVALTGRNEYYYSDFLGTPQELISAARWGYLYQGQRSRWNRRRRGRPALDLPAAAFVVCLENHDQVANSLEGKRLYQIGDAGRVRALTALLLLSPSTPMLFQGQDFAATAPFLFFADHVPQLAPLVAKGRNELMARFPSLAGAEAQARLPDPADPRTFARCKLDPGEREHAGHREALALHRDLLRLRRQAEAFRQQRGDRVAGAVLGEEAFVLRFFVDAGGDGDRAGGDRLLIVNLGRDLDPAAVAEPLLAPPDGHGWRIEWSSEDVRYGGGGAPPLGVEGAAVNDGESWRLPGHAAVVVAPAPHPGG